MKTFSNHQPATIEKVGDGTHYYNYGIKQTERPREDEQEPAQEFEYQSVRIYGELTAENILKAVLRDRRTEAEEIDLLNRYNSFTLGISEDEADKEDYENYLVEIRETRGMVQSDLEDHNEGGGQQ